MTVILLHWVLFYLTLALATPRSGGRGDFHRRRPGGVYTWCDGIAGRKRGERTQRNCLGILAGAGAACGAFLYFLDRSVAAMNPVPRLPRYPWELEGYLASLDHSAVRRGWQVYKTACYACHSLRYVQFMDLIGVSHTVDEVKAIAAEFEIDDGPDEEGNYYRRPGKLNDRIPPPYPNDEAAKATNFGAYPPDLTYFIETKRNGKNYLFALLTGWMDPPAGVTLANQQHFNVYFPGNVISMPQVLSPGLVDYDDGTPSTTSQMAKDLVEFFTWTSAQEFDQRKSMFIKAMGIIFISLAAAIQYKRYTWSYHKTRQIAYVPKEKQ